MQHKQAGSPMGKKVTITRLRTGCWTCRRRGYRCDEEKPACKTCRRLRVPCEGYGVRLKWEHGRSMTGMEETRPTPLCRTRRTNVADSQTCRISHPDTCTPRSVSPAAVTPPLSPNPPLPVLPGQHSSTDVFLLQHYFFTVSSLLSSTPDRTVNTYISTVLPLMLQHDYLLNTVLALSAVHLSNRFPGRFDVYGSKLKGDGMRGLINRLGRCREQRWDEGVLATILMFGILEVFEANASLWSRHLEGAGSFVAEYLERTTVTALDPQESPACYDSPTWRKLLEIYAYHEVLASIALRRAPRLPASFVKGRKSLSDQQAPLDGSGRSKSPEGTSGPRRRVVGLANDFVEDADGGKWSAFAQGPEKSTVFLSAVDSLLSLVAELAEVRSSFHTDAGATHQYAACIVERLRRWRCPDVRYSVETRNTAEAMRQAGILFYYLSTADAEKVDMDSDGITAHLVEAVVSNYDTSIFPGEATYCASDNEEPSQAVDTIIECLGAIAVRHSVVASHVWPLYMAGVAAAHEYQRSFIRDRLAEMIDFRGMKSIIQVRETLDRIWLGQKAGWTVHQYQFSHEGLVLF